MEKTLWFFISILLLITLSACSSKNTNILYETKLTDREKAFLSGGNNQYFAFDYNVDDEYNYVEVWIDSYEFGRKVSRSGGLAADLTERKGTVLAALNEFEEEKHQWTIVINDTGSSKFIEEYPEYNNSLTSKMSGINSTKNISINENEITLASICYIGQNNDTAALSLTNEFYNNPDENMKENEKYNLVYLMKIKFYKKNLNK